MVRDTTTLAVGILIALAVLLPVRGQTGAIVWTTVPNLEFGVNPDGSVSTTSFSIVNRDAVLHTINYSITDAAGNMLGAMTAFVANDAPASSTGAGSIYNLPPFSNTTFIMTALTPTAAVSPMQVNIETRVNDDGLPDVVGSARVVRVAAGGIARFPRKSASAGSHLLLPAVCRVSSGSKVVALFDRADPATAATTPGTAFGVAAVVGVVGNDTVLSVTNSGGAPANVTITLRPTALVDPSITLPTAQVSITPGAPVVRTITQLFPGTVPDQEALVTVVSDQPVFLTAMGLALNGDGPTIATSVSVFKLASTSALSSKASLLGASFPPGF